MKIHLKDFRVFHDFDMEVEGITLIQGQNDSGKSRVMEAVSTVLDNLSYDSQIRYHQPGFEIELETSGRKVKFARTRKGSPRLYLDGTDKPLEKLGRLTLSEIDPSFPLKSFRFGDERFSPNVVLQDDIPVFGQVDVYSFFSAMFDSVARLSRHILTVRTSVLSLTKEEGEARQALEVAMAEELNNKRVLESYNPEEMSNLSSHLSQVEKTLDELVNLRSQLASHQSAIKRMEPYEVLASVDFEQLASEYSAVVRALEIHAARRSLAEKLDEISGQLHALSVLPEAADLDAMVAGYRMTVRGLDVNAKLIDLYVSHSVNDQKLTSVLDIEAALPRVEQSRDQLRLIDRFLAQHRSYCALLANLHEVQLSISDLSQIDLLVQASSVLSLLMAARSEHDKLTREIENGDSTINLVKQRLMQATTCPLCKTEGAGILAQHLEEFHV